MTLIPGLVLEMPGLPWTSPRAAPELSGDLVNIVGTSQLTRQPERDRGPAAWWGPRRSPGIARWQLASLARLFQAP